MIWVLIAAAAVEASAPVTTLTDATAIHAQLRAELRSENHGLERTEAYTPKATSRFEVQNAQVKLDGKISEATDYAFRANFLTPATPLDYAYGTYWFNKMIGWSVGKMKVKQGGWDNHEYDQVGGHASGTFYDNLVYGEFEPMTALTVRAAGTLTLQVLNDKVTGRDAVASWNKKEHPTWVVSYDTEFGPISPLITLGSYDNNKSRWVDAGVSTSMNGLFATLDIFNHNHVVRYVKPTGESEGEANVATAITVYASYEIKGAAMPWFYYSTYDDKQAEAKAHKLEDHQFNTTRAADGSLHFDQWDDNGQVVGGGIDVKALGERWVPYVAVISRSGKFEDAKKPGEQETKSETVLRVGAYASF